MQLVVELTDDQYQRFKSALQKINGSDEETTDEQLIGQMKREASAIIYAAEIGRGDGTNWVF